MTKCAIQYFFFFLVGENINFGVILLIDDIFKGIFL